MTSTQVVSYEICELFKNTFFPRTPPVAASENHEQQQLSEGFANSCYKIVSLILPQELINDFAVCKRYSGILLLVENVTSSHVLETRTTYFKKDPHFLLDQPRTCRVFTLSYVKSIFFN